MQTHHTMRAHVHSVCNGASDGERTNVIKTDQHKGEGRARKTESVPIRKRPTGKKKGRYMDIKE